MSHSRAIIFLFIGNFLLWCVQRPVSANSRSAIDRAYLDLGIAVQAEKIFDFEKPTNNFVAALFEYASWGYFDFRMKGEGFDEGYQSVPVNWKISSERKRGFFKVLRDITGGNR